MLLGDVVGNEKEDQQFDGFSVRGFKRNGLGESNEGGQRGFEPPYAAMGNCHAMPQPRRPQSLAGKEIVRHGRAGNPAVIFEYQPGLFESTFFA